MVHAGSGGAFLCGIYMVMTTLTAIVGGANAMAEGTSLGQEPWLAQAASEQRRFDIPPQPLADALTLFGRQSGMQVSVDAGLVRGIASPGATGTMSPEQALGQLLSGTGITYSLPGGNTAMLERVESATGAIRLDPVTIYGAKDTNSLNDTAASVGIVTAEDIADSQIRTFRDSFRRLGNVMDGDWTDAGFIIRGVSSEGFVPGGALVGSLYIDGVLQTMNGARRGARGLWDVEQVEVYRGPQSTFSGRAAMAGAIYIKTKDPTFDTKAELSGTLGSDSLLGTALMVNAPVFDDQVAVRFAGEFERSKNDLNYPTYERFDRFDDLVTDRYYNLRGKVLVLPKRMPTTSALLSYSFAHDAPTPRDIGTGPDFDLSDDRGDFNIPTFSEVRSTDVHNVGLEVTHDIAKSLRFTSLTGLTYSLTRRPSVNEGTAGEIDVVKGDQKDLLVTQELRLNYDGETTRWVGGLYASYEDYDTTFNRTLFALRNDQSFLKRKTTNVAGFGEITYEFLPSWNVTLGGRADYTLIDSSQFGYRTQPLGATPIVTTDYATEIKEFNFVPKAGISKDFGDLHKAGFLYTQGFRTGGYGVNASTSTVYHYDPESAQNFELFYKGRLFDHRMSLNANVFYTRYSNQQVEMRLDPSDPFSREITNAASSRSYGFEIEPNVQVTDQLSAFVSLGYVNTKFEDFNHVSYGDLTGQPFPEAPKWTVAFGAHYAFGNGIYAGADAKYTSSYLARFGTPPQDRLDPRTIVNVQTGYRAESWEINAFAENLLDERYYTYFDSAGGNDYATLGAGRRFGVNVKAKF